VTDISGIVGSVGALFFLVVFVALHRLRRDISPISGYVSEYAHGKYGLLFRSSLIVHGLSNIIMLFGLTTTLNESLERNLSVALLMIASVGFILGGIFCMDKSESPRTLSGRIHSIIVFATVFIEFIGIAIVVFVFSASSVFKPLTGITATLASAGLLAVVWFLTALRFKFSPGLAERSIFIPLLFWEIIVSMSLV